MLLDKVPHDFDLTTNATPAESKEAFDGYSSINNNGEKHGTVTVRIGSENVEITTYRLDGEYTNHRQPDTVFFTGDVVEDLKRRDFTVNAFISDGVYAYDYFDGFSDLERRVIRCVGNAEDRFEEDALRILRAMRFASVLGFTIDTATLLAMKKKKELLKSISKERIKTELDKMVVGKGFARVAILCSDILGFIIPALGDCVNFDHLNPYHYLDVYEHIIYVVDAIEATDSITKIAGLLHDIGKPKSYQDIYEDGKFIKRTCKHHADKSYELAAQILEDLRYSTYEKDFILALVKYHDYDFSDNVKCMKKFLQKIPESIDKDVFMKSFLSLRQADRKIHINIPEDSIISSDRLAEIYREVVTNTADNAFNLKDLKVNGYDIMSLGFKGPEIGLALTTLLDAVIEEKVINEKQSLINYLEKLNESKGV